MSTCLIDRTLSYLPVNAEFVSKEQLLKYIDAVFDCGADYVEINSDILKILDGVDLSERYILKITSVEDVKLSFDYKLAYVSMHIGMRPFFKSISQVHNIIAEVYADEYSSELYLSALKDNDVLSYISMLRLTGILSSDSENTQAFMNRYRFHFHIPLDICPINTMLSGSGDAIDFYKHNADSVALSFGRNHYYTSFEDFLINRQLMQQTPMSHELISALCNASLAFMRVFCSIPSGVDRIVFKDNPAAAPVYDIEKGLVFRPVKAIRKNPQSPETILEKQIKTIGLEREIEDAIIDMLKSTNFSFYQNIIKRNIID